jgi:hypothetical protein
VRFAQFGKRGSALRRARRHRHAQLERIAIALVGGAQEFGLAEGRRLPDQESDCREREQPLEEFGRKAQRDRAPRRRSPQQHRFIHAQSAYLPCRLLLRKRTREISP